MSFEMGVKCAALFHMGENGMYLYDKVPEVNYNQHETKLNQ